MNAIIGDATIDSMTAESNKAKADRLADRIGQLGLTKAALANASGKSRGTIDKALAGDTKVREATYADLFRVLDDIEADREPGVQHYTPDGVADVVTIQMTGVFGIESVTFTGPTDDVEAIKRLAVDFVREARDGTTS